MCQWEDTPTVASAGIIVGSLPRVVDTLRDQICCIVVFAVGSRSVIVFVAFQQSGPLHSRMVVLPAQIFLVRFPGQDLSRSRP